MTRKWHMEVEAANDKPGTCVIQLKICDPGTDLKIEAIPGCSNLDQLRAEIASLKDELDQLLRSAETKFQELAANASQTQGSHLDPEAVWEKMESSSSEEEMFQVFNALDAGLRQETADYIFTHAGMFKGRGPVFAEHYNLVSHLLEV
jgi:septal ring factor EnvC (AmiA/AmiB activator)